MQIASILSDLTSLRVCEHSAALALVSVHKSGVVNTPEKDKNKDGGPKVKAEHDPDMQRAMDLVELHYGVKINHIQGGDGELKEAREGVSRVLEKLQRTRSVTLSS